MTATYGSIDMRADWCTSGDEVCDIASDCTVCDTTICPDHCDDFVTCVANPDARHCGDCRHECEDCEGAAAQDDYEDRYEQAWRGED